MLSTDFFFPHFDRQIVCFVSASFSELVWDLITVGDGVTNHHLPSLCPSGCIVTACITSGRFISDKTCGFAQNVKTKSLLKPFSSPY